MAIWPAAAVFSAMCGVRAQSGSQSPDQQVSEMTSQPFVDQAVLADAARFAMLVKLLMELRGKADRE